MHIQLCIGGRIVACRPEVILLRGRLWGPLIQVAEHLGGRVRYEDRALWVGKGDGSTPLEYVVLQHEPPPASDGFDNVAWERSGGGLCAPLIPLVRWFGAAWMWDPHAPAVRVVRREPALLGRRIAIDPGHGGADPGVLAVGGVPEKNLNLDVSRRVADYLSAAGATARLVRDADYDLEVDARIARADSGAGLDLLLSIHHNWSPRPQVRGVEVYHNRAPGAERLALAVGRELAHELSAEYTHVGPAPIESIRPFLQPAVHIECAYLSDAGEARALETAWRRERQAMAIYRGTRAFCEKDLAGF